MLFPNHAYRESLCDWTCAGQRLQCKDGKTYMARDIALRHLYVFGWSVEVDGKVVGNVDEIIHIGKIDEDIDIDIPYEYILKVVGSATTEGASESLEGAKLNSVLQHHVTIGSGGKQMPGIKILIPIVDEFIKNIDVKKRRLLVKVSF